MDYQNRKKARLARQSGGIEENSRSIAALARVTPKRGEMGQNILFYLAWHWSNKANALNIGAQPADAWTNDAVSCRSRGRSYNMPDITGGYMDYIALNDDLNEVEERLEETHYFGPILYRSYG